MYLSISELSLAIGVSQVTLRRWDRSGKLHSNFRTIGGHRRYKLSSVMEKLGLAVEPAPNRVHVAYARCSSHDQKDDLERQAHRLMASIGASNKTLIKDLGSGINFKKKGLKELINLVVSGRVDTIYITRKDRLLRFGYELVEMLCRTFGTKIIVLDQSTETNEESLAKDVLTIITVFSARLDGQRSHKNKKNFDKKVE